MPDANETGENRPNTPDFGLSGLYAPIGPMFGGAVLGVGLTILPMALDRAEMPSPLPSSLSWHHPDRVVALRIGEYGQQQYIDLEVAIVEDIIRGRLDDDSRRDALAYLRQRGSAESIRRWADSLDPVPDLSDALAAAFVVAPISWEMEPGESVDPAYSELAISVDTEPVSEISPIWPSVSESPVVAELLSKPELAEVEPPPVAPAPVAPPEPVAPTPVQHVAQPPTVLASAVTPVVDSTPAVASIESGPREAAIGQNRLYVELSEGDPESVAPAVSRRLSQLVQCYENALEFDSSVRGDVEFEWNIRRGRVNSLAVSDDSLGDEIAVRCMSERIRRWRFEPDASGLVSWRFAFDSNPG